MVEEKGTTSVGEQLDRVSEQLGISRRGFMKFCSGVAATMGLSSTAGIQIAQAAASPKRPPVIWLSGQECTGCTEALLRSQHPTLENLLLDLISLDYGETLSTAAGHLAEENKYRSMEENKGQYLLVIDHNSPEIIVVGRRIDPVGYDLREQRPIYPLALVEAYGPPLFEQLIHLLRRGQPRLVIR